MMPYDRSRYLLFLTLTGAPLNVEWILTKSSCPGLHLASLRAPGRPHPTPPSSAMAALSPSLDLSAEWLLASCLSPCSPLQFSDPVVEQFLK